MCDAATKPASDRYFPATHAVQDAVVSPVALLHVPKPQIVQSESSSWLDALVASFKLYLPAGHAVHDVAVPTVAVYVPAGHVVQVCTPAALNVPIAQDVHDAAPTGLYVPAAHVAQSASAS